MIIQASEAFLIHVNSLINLFVRVYTAFLICLKLEFFYYVDIYKTKSGSYFTDIDIYFLEC